MCNASVSVRGTFCFAPPTPNWFCPNTVTPGCAEISNLPDGLAHEIENVSNICLSDFVLSADFAPFGLLWETQLDWQNCFDVYIGEKFFFRGSGFFNRDSRLNFREFIAKSFRMETHIGIV